MPRPTDVPGWVALTKADLRRMGRSEDSRRYIDDTGQERSRRAYLDARDRLAGWTGYRERSDFAKAAAEHIRWEKENAPEGWKGKDQSKLLYLLRQSHFDADMKLIPKRTDRPPGPYNEYLEAIGRRPPDASYPPGETPAKEG